MTYPISDVTRRVVYSGSAGTGPYSFSFEILAQTDIAVYFNDTLLTITTDYTVSINVDGTGSITIVTGTGVPTTPDADDTITILGNKGIQRQTDFVTGGDLFATSLNDELDAQTIFAQQNAEAIGRAIKIPPQSSLSIDTTLPVPQANYILGWNDDGTAILNLQEIGSYSGTDATTTTANYNNRDLVKSTTAGQLNNVYICIQDSPAGTALTNTSYWALLVDAKSSSDAQTAAEAAQSAAEDAQDYAEEWANKAEDSLISIAAGGDGADDYSALHWANKSADSAAAALVSENNAAPVNAIVSEITTVAGISANVTTVAGISANVTTVAGIDSDVTTVAGIAADVTAAANISSDIQDVQDKLAEIQTVADDLNEAVSEIDTVANIASDVETVGGIAANVTTVAGISGNVTTVAGISANVTTVAGVSANVTTVAGISADVTTVAGDSADIQLLADNIGTIGDKVSKAGDTMTGDLILNTTGALTLPVGTEAQRPTPVKGMFRFNDDSDAFEGYDGAEWGAVGGGNTAVVGWENQITVAENYTITTGNNMMSAGPVTIDSGFTISIPTGSRWVIL